MYIHKMITTSLIIIHHHTVDPLHTFHPHPNPPFPSVSLWSVLHIYKFTFILFGLFYRFHIWMKSHSICLSLSDLCYLAWHVQGLPMLSQVAEFHSFVWLSGIKYIWYIYIYVYIYIYLTSSFSIRSSMDIWNVPHLGYCKWCHNEYKGANL